jgi:hypothetical protein
LSALAVIPIGNIVTENLKGRPLEIPGCRCEDDIKMYLKEREYLHID